MRVPVTNREVIIMIPKRVIRETLMGIPKPAIRKISCHAGAKRIKDSIHEQINPFCIARAAIQLDEDLRFRLFYHQVISFITFF